MLHAYSDKRMMVERGVRRGEGLDKLEQIPPLLLVKEEDSCMFSEEGN